MRIVITGGAGFIGSHTADLLLEQGMQIIVLDNLSSGTLDNLNLAHPHLQFIQGDVRDFALLKSIIKNGDAVLHLAAVASVPKSIEDPVTTLQINTLGFLQVLQAIRETNPSIRLVYASSAAVYGDAKSLPCNDEIPLTENALSPYALQKADNERYADLYSRLFGINSLGLRYFNVYGSRQDPSSPYSGVISKFIECYQQHQPITIFGDGEQSRDFISVADVARANSLALQSNVSGVMNIASGKPETLNNLVRYIEQIGDMPAIVRFTESRQGDISVSYAKIDKAKKFLKFSSSFLLPEGVLQIVNSIYNP